MNPPPLKILAVDSEQLLLWALKRAGESRELNIETAATAEQALTEICRGHFDLFLLALDVRDFTHLKLLREIDEKCPYVPIVVMTTSDISSCQLNDAIKTVRRHGAWHLLEKPFRMERILAFIDLIFQESGRFRCSLHEVVQNFEHEKRVQTRRPHIIPADYSYTSISNGEEVKTFTSGIVTDISDCGLGLLTWVPLEKDMVISFGDVMMRQTGVVTWSAEFENEIYRSGVMLH